MKKVEMAHVVQATMAVPGCPVLTSNQAHAVAMSLREIIEQDQGEPVGRLYRIDEKVVMQVVGDPHITDGMPVYTNAHPGKPAPPWSESNSR